jgi:hypothetical protein
MNEKKTRIIFFALGMSLGLILGGVVVRVYSDKVYSENYISQNVVAKLFGKVFGLIYTRNKNNNSQNDTTQNKNTNYIGNNNSIARDSIADFESSENNYENTDSTDSNKTIGNINDENIVVLKDQLLKSQKEKIIKIVGQENKLSTKDSLLKKNAGIKENLGTKELIIEYWQSPLNYKGYKLAKNKLIVFGINENEPLKIFDYGNSLFLRFQGQYVKLENRQEFKSFEKYTDQEIISILDFVGKSKTN